MLEKTLFVEFDDISLAATTPRQIHPCKGECICCGFFFVLFYLSHQEMKKIISNA